MKGCNLAILQSLLSEADFFVDGKDLQTFVGATSQSRFFFARRSCPSPRLLPRRYEYERRLRLAAGSASLVCACGGV